MKAILFVVMSLSIMSSYYSNIQVVKNNYHVECHHCPKDGGIGGGNINSTGLGGDDINVHHPDIIQNPGFTMEEYFQNLITYSPDNSFGSCSYVSLIQYLSYYDTFHNDRIIPEQFDRHYTLAANLTECKSDSPGVLKQTYPNGSSALYDYVMANKDSDFQAYLMYVVNQALGHGRYTYSDEVAYSDYHYIFENLIYATGSITSSTTYYSEYGSSFTSSNVQSSLINYAKSIIDTGNPVIVQIVNGDLSQNHSVVAYDYDSIRLICNFGWGNTGSTYLYAPNTVYTYIYSVTTSNISSISHSHSNNYVVSTLGYCGCGQHKHSNNFMMINSLTHYRTCPCGYSAVENHIYQNIGGVNKCECGHVQ